MLSLPFIDALFRSRRRAPQLYRRPFRFGKRPVIRWIKGAGKDDVVTRSAIAQATRLFADSVDYCLCTAGISAARARDVLAWATQPVEWWPVQPSDNPQLADVLMAAGCRPDNFGYWWKWFPERVRPEAPEWIADGDMVVTAAPAWFDAWRHGRDCLRVSQDDACDINEPYGEYLSFIDRDLRLYSGLISLPPKLHYLPVILDVLKRQPLACEHDGRVNMSEQGVIAAAMGQLEAVPIPLHEFPFAKAYEPQLIYGQSGPRETPWGYHFSYAFRTINPHFERLVADGEIDWKTDAPAPGERFQWLRNHGQWGRPGYSMHRTCVERVIALARPLQGRPVLEIATSRGYLSAILASLGCMVTTVDHTNRGARQNLEGLEVQIESGNAADFLTRCTRKFSLIVVDLHGNSVEVWKRLWPLLCARLDTDGRAVLYNSHLWKVPEWKTQTGLKWVMESQLQDWAVDVFEEPWPGMIVCHRV